MALYSLIVLIAVKNLLTYLLTYLRDVIPGVVAVDSVLVVGCEVVTVVVASVVVIISVVVDGC